MNHTVIHCIYFILFFESYIGFPPTGYTYFKRFPFTYFLGEVSDLKKILEQKALE